jgi:hypothetical protein
VADLHALTEAVNALDSPRAIVFSLATSHRVFTVYQAYCEHHQVEKEFRGIEGGLREIRGELHGAKNATQRVVQHALRTAEDVVSSLDAEGVPEELVAASLATAIYSFSCYLHQDPTQAAQASTSALDLVDFWVDAERWRDGIERSPLASPIPDPRVDAEMEHQLRDASELSRMEQELVAASGIRIVLRAERESLQYLHWMQSTLLISETGGSPRGNFKD